MATITEDYVSFEIAKLLKEKGFNEPCYACYLNKELSHYDYTSTNFELIEDVISAPTQQMAIKWLRKEKGIAVVPIISSILDNKRFLWDIEIIVAKTNETYHQGWIYESCERAYEAAIKYCLENLI